MKKYVLYLLMAVVVSGIVYTSYSTYETKQNQQQIQAKQQAEGGLETGMKAPDLELEQDGQPVRLSDLTDQLIVINFWATWCPPCRQEIPELNRFSESTNIPVYGINVTTAERRLTDVEQFLKQTPITYSVLYDTKGQSEKAYRLVAMPATYIIDRTGKIVGKHVGPVTEKMLQEMVQKIGG
ncbi:MULTISPECIES: TlpA disulfide reductase family protein [Exiguobacterium]|uniref:TlpA family protein disulfide reductase n=1 Tax=Exiguobacterium TaxID=33986 RepID=UPI00047CBA76|nr:MULTISPECIES: TlpA disulfide reductase family protein [Exiguobacterium]MCT4781553.1 TlpA family protein disulfide reductase [Exiguobacterium soli]